ncbi:MAG: glycosyltransferase family 1 protein [Caldilineae bacterium]|nr:MAG: glycosyltransferase family 1 protein [Caldilineae bacterium]
MRIGIDARLTYHQNAGISRYTIHLLNELTALDRTNEYLVFQHRKHKRPLVEAPNFRRVTLYAPVHTRLEQAMLVAELAFHQLDLIHSTDFIPPLYSRTPAVITVHDLGFLRWPHFLTKDHARYYSQIDRGVRRARHIIVPSQSTKNDVVAQLGAPEGKISVIYEAAAPRYHPRPLEETRAAITRKYGLPERYILFVSTIEPRKNIGGLLRAYHHLRRKYNVTDTGLVLVGKRGWLYEKIFETVEELGLQDSTFFVGRVPDEDLAQLYVGARCHVHPAFYEGFGLPPLEAMASGTPTVVSNTSSLPEVVGDAALLVDPYDWEEMAVAIHRLLTDDHLHAELRAKGLQRAAVFSWTRAASETLDVYRRVVEETRTVGAPSTSRSSA